MSIAFDHITEASENISGRVCHTSCARSERLSDAIGCEIYFKMEYLQRTGSFKERGACNALMSLNEQQKRCGVVAASAGNHALGLAYHGKKQQIPVTVVMPIFAPLTKVGNCRRLGANVVQHGENFAEAAAKAHELEQQGLTYINGYDDPAVIAGQGTIGLEILQQVPDVEVVVVPLGGGGLIAGISLAVKTLKPHVQIIGVEPRNAAAYLAALEAGKPVEIDVQPTLADGLAVPAVGANAFELARKHVDRVVTVDEREIALAVLRLVEMEKAVVEGAGAAGLAACMAGQVPQIKGKTIAVPLCGGNIDTQMLGRIIERGLAADGRLCHFEARISDRPGGLAKLASVIASEGASVHDVMHERAWVDDDLTGVNVRCIVETSDFDHIRRLRDRLKQEGFAPAFQHLPQ